MVDNDEKVKVGTEKFKKNIQVAGENDFLSIDGNSIWNLMKRFFRGQIRDR